MKKIAIILMLFVFTIGVFSACGEKKAQSYDEIVSDIKNSEEKKEEKKESGQSDLNIEIIGQKVSVPFDFSMLTQNGYTIVDSTQEKAIYDGVNTKVPLVVLTNEKEKQEELYGSPYINVDVFCGAQSKDSMKDVSVVGFTLQTVEKKYMSVNGFGWNDNTDDFMKTVNHDYAEEVGTYKDNINTGEYVVMYKYSDLWMRVHSTDGKIRIIEVEAVDNNE